MSKEITDKAKEYLEAGLSIVLTGLDKRPVFTNWGDLQTNKLTALELDEISNSQVIRSWIKVEKTNRKREPYTDYGMKLFNTPEGLGIIAGAVSGGLEVIDVDTKNDTTGTLWEEFRDLIEDNLPDLYNRLVIAQTKNGGYHIYYRCSLIAGNQPLAKKTNKDVLIETRGEGGYVVAPPSPGYKYIQGEPGNIPTIAPEERAILFSLSKSFNELEEAKAQSNTSSATTEKTGLSPLEHYNESGDVVELLERKGWKKVGKKGQRIYLLRPEGSKKSEAKSSGNFHEELRVFKVFSSSTDFETDRGYSASQVYAILECNNDYKLAYRKLLALGYGQPYEGDKQIDKQVKTERIKVEVVNSVNKETSVISNPGELLSIEDIETSIGTDVIITSPGGLEAQEEVLKTIEKLFRAGKRIYIKEGSNELREYRYILNTIFNKYGAIQEETGELTDRDKHSLLDEVVILSSKLQPIDKDLFLKFFISLEPIKELGISEESLSITVDRLTSTRDKEAQAKDLKKLLSEAHRLQDLGNTDKVIELLDSNIKEVKLKDKATEFSSLMIPIKEKELKERQAKKPESLSSGYNIGGEPLLLPSGAISIFTAPTSHGKTTFLINLALNVATAYPDKETYLFSYEEDGDSILINTLNTYLDEDISSNNRRTLKTYFTTGSTEYIKTDNRDYFTSAKDVFFRELIETRRLNIHYSNYNSDTLIEAIRYLHKHAKPGAIFIDYIQLLNLPEGKYKTYSRQEEIKEICIALKDVAVETGLPIILGAQFNREVVNQVRIHATKIGEAGDIERIANLIVGFWNNNFKPLGTDGELNEINNKGANTPDTLYTTILKNRGGRVGLEEILSFNGNTGKIKTKSKNTSKPLKENPF